MEQQCLQLESLRMLILSPLRHLLQKPPKLGMYEEGLKQVVSICAPDLLRTLSGVLLGTILVLLPVTPCLQNLYLILQNPNSKILLPTKLYIHTLSYSKLLATLISKNSRNSYMTILINLSCTPLLSD